MKKRRIFEGIATALITPMTADGIDYPALSELIERQIECGITALVIAGTTGEASTLTESERTELYRFTRERTRGRAILVLGTGSNDTERAVRYTRESESVGADGALVVTPYYNKGTVEGVLMHYERIAEETEIPIILYNVPSRTGVNLPIETVRELSKNPRVYGIKEASDSLDRQMALCTYSSDLPIYSGNDSGIYINLALGGAGTVSVISNLFPRSALAIYEAYKSGEQKRALEIQKELLPMISLLFGATNPAPIKYAMSLCTCAKENMRLPLYPISDGLREQIKNEYLRLIGLGYR